MDAKQKEEIILNSLDGLKALNGEIHHPEALILFSSIQCGDDPDKGRTISAAIGCTHGMIDAIVHTALENDQIKCAVLKAAKKLKKMDKKDDGFPPGFPPELKEILGMIGGGRKSFEERLNEKRGESTEGLEAAAAGLLDQLEKAEPDQKDELIRSLHKRLIHPFHKREVEETMMAYMTRVTHDDVPPNVRKLAEYVDNYKPAPASAN